MAGGLEAPTTQAVNLNAAGKLTGAGGLNAAGGLNGAGGVQLRPDGVAPAPVGVVSQAVTARPPTVEALAPGRYRVQFTASAALRDKLERLRALLQPTAPDADLATVIELAITEKLERLEARRFAQSPRPRKQLSDTDTTPQFPACSGGDPSGRSRTRRPAVRIRQQGAAGAALRATGWSTTTDIRSAWVGTTGRRTSCCSVGLTTPGWPSRTTAGARSLDIAPRRKPRSPVQP